MRLSCCLLPDRPSPWLDVRRPWLPGPSCMTAGASLGRVVVSASHNIDDVAWHPKQYMLAYPGYSGRDHMGEHANIEFRWLPQQ